MRSIIDLSHNLGLDVVAEGVEDADTLARLAEMGCDRAQGFYLSRPVPADELAAWIADPGRHHEIATVLGGAAGRRWRAI